MVKKQVVVGVVCPSCEQEISGENLIRCVICRTQFCSHCAVIGYGREFCSHRCREYFFHGDSEEEDNE